LLLAGIATICPFYAVRLYRINDSIIGGLAKANYGYTGGLLVLFLGNALTCWGFLSARRGFVYAGSIILVAGIGVLLAACSVLFHHIVRGGIRSSN